MVNCSLEYPFQCLGAGECAKNANALLTYNSQTGEMYHPNSNYGDPIGPHWDYTDASGVEYHIMPDGSKVPKYGGK